MTLFCDQKADIRRRFCVTCCCKERRYKVAKDIAGHQIDHTKMTSIYRRTLLKNGAALGASQVIGAPFIISALGDEPVKIGMVNPVTGALSALAQSEVDGAKYAEAEINKNGGILGRPIQLLVEDSGNDIGASVQKTRKLIERDQVTAILGSTDSGMALAMAAVANEKRVLHIVTGGHANPLTGTSCKWNVFRVCGSTSMDVNAVTAELIKRFGKRWFFISPDYAYGHTLQDAFVKALNRFGGTSDGDSGPVNNPDIASSLGKARSYKPNVLINNLFGQAQINCIRQFNQLNMGKDMVLAGALFELENIKSAQADAQAGWWTMDWWWAQRNVPETARFVSDYRGATKKTPSARDWFGYVSMHSVRLAAIRAKSLESLALSKALENMELPREIALQPGTARYRAADHQLMSSLFVGEVHPPKAGPDDVFAAASIVPGEQAADPVADNGCKMEQPA
jgi:branched-chain amino acid transport system substrate-binding protein